MKFLVNVSVMIAQEGELDTWKIGTKSNSAMIHKIIIYSGYYGDITFSVVADAGT